jgi:hypothetical protein
MSGELITRGQCLRLALGSGIDELVNFRRKMDKMQRDIVKDLEKTPEKQKQMIQFMQTNMEKVMYKHNEDILVSPLFKG